jgi:DNA (cytosine-5)-methyltransferase 1
MLAIDLFSGAGGLCLGMKSAGVKVVLSNELETDFAKTHEINFPEVRMLNRDVAAVDFRAELKDMGLGPGDVDIVAGGPPCQGFSTVGKKNLADPRNSLFTQFLRVVEEVEPGYVIFENVSGFKKLYSGAIYKKILGGLEDQGFDHVSGILNARDFGAPQSRARTIVLAWRRGLRPLSMPRPTHGASRPFLTLMEAISDLPFLHPGEERADYLCDPQNDYQKSMRAKNSTLTEHACARYGERMRAVISRVPPGGSVMDLPEELRPKRYFKNTYARLLPDAPSPTMTRNFGTPSSSRCIHPFQNRALSTREGARIQGFPDHYVFHGSKTRKNLQIGNAVPPILGEVLARQVIEST